MITTSTTTSTTTDDDDELYSIPVFNNDCYTQVSLEHLPVNVNPSYCHNNQF